MEDSSWKIYEAQLSDELLSRLIAFSADWEAENSTYGYRENERSDIEGNRIFLAEMDGEIVGYLFGHPDKAKRAGSIMADETPFFEIEELYVIPRCRCAGIGKALFRYAEQQIKKTGIEFIMLSTATKNYKSILHFYIEELGMDFWSARLFRKI